MEKRELVPRIVALINPKKNFTTKISLFFKLTHSNISPVELKIQKKMGPLHPETLAKPFPSENQPNLRNSGGKSSRFLSAAGHKNTKENKSKSIYNRTCLIWVHICPRARPRIAPAHSSFVCIRSRLSRIQTSKSIQSHAT